MAESESSNAALAAIIETAVKMAVEAAVSQARQIGFVEGVQAGRVIGYVEGVNALTPAISDGLRHGSPECARAMRALTNLRAIPTGKTEEFSSD